MTYQKLDMGNNWINIKVDMSKLKGFNGKVRVEFLSYDGKVHLSSWDIIQGQPQIEWTDGGTRPDHLEDGAKMYHGMYDDIIDNFEPEPLYP